MVKYFITVSGGVITGVHSGDMNADFFGTDYYGHERIEIPKEAETKISSLDRVEFYDSKWNRKSDIQLIEEKLLPIPEGYVKEGKELRRMTQEERIIAGLDELQSGQKIVDNEIVSMSLQEQVAAGLITQNEYEQHLAAVNDGELQRRLASLQTPEALAQAELDDAYAASRKANLAALLAVKQQDGWPVTVEWPEE